MRVIENNLGVAYRSVAALSAGLTLRGDNENWDICHNVPLSKGLIEMYVPAHYHLHR
jgi:hypothetical protein